MDMEESMDYQYENLGPERFQELIQSLLTKQFPRLQCFPISQPDGGRDAIAFYSDKYHTDFIVFQVKFVRNPFKQMDTHKWLINIISKESPKVRKLIPKGAKEYYLITNVPGTAHLDAGSIDKIERILNDTLGIPSHCWWRGDLSRRLDDSWDLKWVYPELLTGIDMLRHVIQSRLKEHQEERTSAIRAYVRSQYDEDREIRFKQVDLQNELLELFIDVPIIIRHSNAYRKHQNIIHTIRRIEYEIQETTGAISERRNYDDKSVACAASVLLHPLAQRDIPQIVLEGGPGQGKSTIVQYICQIHRMKILNESKALILTPKQHQAAPVRIPFKVELRDFASWINRRDPFSFENGNKLPVGWQKSLEAFLAAQVRYYSGGCDFSVTDLHSVAQVSNFLIVLDGLDEVADISTRREVVKEAIIGIKRLRESSKNIQVIVTSRPAAFANSPGFPEKDFPYFDLGSITKELINEYADKWIKARRLHDRHGAEVKKILDDKLTEQHISELAKNPMQLAILLSLIHTRGISLPDKRTALYDSYVELFFNREAEKSDVVRKYRDLLIDIHRYLAWSLHSDVEKGNERGRISIDRLHQLLENYLDSEGRDPSIAKDLFTGMVERVVALVSRIEGTYEFEVQPLREYFAARHLYETAPYSPTGSEKRGTKPDRFDALARNFYWHNVTRFYAGCYSKGELPSLVDGLIELVEEKGYRHTNYPRRLAAWLLSDWVFEQNPKSMKKVISIVLDGLDLGYTLNESSQYRGSSNQIVLPKGCGRERLVTRCFDALRNNPAKDYAYELIQLIKANSVFEEIQDIWFMETQKVDGAERTRWMNYGLSLELLPKINNDQLESLMSDEINNKERLHLVLRAKHTDFIEMDNDRCNAIIDAILDEELSGNFYGDTSSILDWFSVVLEPFQYAIAFGFQQSLPLTEVRKHYLFPTLSIRETDFRIVSNDSQSLQNCIDVIKVAERESLRTTMEWASRLTPWDNIVEKSRSLFGERWAHFVLANVASGIKSRDETCKDFPYLLDHSSSLCRRTRYARLRAGNYKWWVKQIEKAETSLELMFVSLLILTWSSRRTLARLSEPLGDILDNLSYVNWVRFSKSIRTSILTRSKNLIHISENLPNDASDRLVTSIAMRATYRESIQLFQKYLNNYSGNDSVILEFSQISAFRLLQAKPNELKHNLEIIKKRYAQGIVAEQYYWQHLGREEYKFLPLGFAEKIVENAKKYPYHLVELAEFICKNSVASAIIPVGEIAKKDGWFNS